MITARSIGRLLAGSMLLAAASCSGGSADPAVVDPVTGSRAVVLSGPSPFRAGCSATPTFVNAEAEPAIAADPRRPSRLVAVYQQDRNHTAGARGIVAAVSQTGGSSWRRSALPVSRCAGASARQAPFASDPWVSIGPDGRIYASAVSDVVSVTTSTDWGRSWSRPATLRGSGITDKPAITADPRRAGTAYVVWSDYRRTNPPGTESDELVAVTHNGGRSWSAPRIALRHGERAGPGSGQILVDPRTGRLYLLMAWIRDGFATAAEPATMMIADSGDKGVHWSAPRRFALGSPAATRGGPVIRSSPQVPSFAIDAHGVIYGVWQDARFARGAHEDILFTRSSDGGRTWRRPRQISASSNAGAIIPTVAAQGNGAVAVLYLQLERRDTLVSRYRVAVTGDGGTHLRDLIVSRTFAVTGAPKLTSSPLVPGGYFVGDYMGVTEAGPGAFATAFVVATGDDGNKTDVLNARVSTQAPAP